MIALHSVSKEVGRGKLRKVVLNDVSWHIPAREHVVILGQRGAGKSLLMQLISGARFPTKGWVERKGSICWIPGLLRVGGGNVTVRQIVQRLARLYHMDVKEIVQFVQHFAQVDRVIDTPLAVLPGAIRSRITYALAYAIPFDFYLFDGTIGGRKGEFGDRCQTAFDIRSQQAGIIFTASSAKAVAQFGETVRTVGLLHNGALRFYPSLDEALSVFSALPPPPPDLYTAAPEHQDAEPDGGVDF